MKTFAIIAQKGGAGKTTLAVNLSVYAEASGYTTALIDVDPQASAAKWGDKRTAETPEVISAQASRLDSFLISAREAGADLVIIDTAPNSDSTALAAAQAADLILIPCRPAAFDLEAIASTVQLARLAGKPAIVVLNAAPIRGSLIDEARQAIATYSVAVAPTVLHQRAAYSNAVIDGRTAGEYEPGGKAAAEIAALFGWLEQQARLSDGETVGWSTIQPHKRKASA
jgi:chromosome partitioning protein